MAKSKSKDLLPDVARERPAHEIVLDGAGISNFRYPLTITRKNREPTVVQSFWDVRVRFPATERGVHMSRMVGAILEIGERPVTIADLDKVAEKIANDHVVFKEDTHIEVCFDYPIPVYLPRDSEVTGYNYIQVAWSYPKEIFRIAVPVSTTCPCSKAISSGGAHNQRARVIVDYKPRGGVFIFFEDIADWIEQCGSAVLRPYLKREDEKWITEKGYNNPRFVEDVCRAAVQLLQSQILDLLCVRVDSEESIHQHNATAIWRSNGLDRAQK
jgi:GTP cyclohydrolase I